MGSPLQTLEQAIPWPGAIRTDGRAFTNPESKALGANQQTLSLVVVLGLVRSGINLQ